jgi:hypothetical protein
MKVVSENSEAELAQREAMGQVRWALRDLAANLMRIIRGAGKPWEIGQQAQALINSIIAYREAAGYSPSSDENYKSPIARRWPGRVDRFDKHGSRNRMWAEDIVIRGCLQIAASRLLYQNTQRRAGEHEMYDGLRDLEEARKEARKAWAEPTKRRQVDTEVKRMIEEARKKPKARGRPS